MPAPHATTVKAPSYPRLSPLVVQVVNNMDKVVVDDDDDDDDDDDRAANGAATAVSSASDCSYTYEYERDDEACDIAPAKARLLLCGTMDSYDDDDDDDDDDDGDDIVIDDCNGGNVDSANHGGGGDNNDEKGMVSGDSAYDERERLRAEEEKREREREENDRRKRTPVYVLDDECGWVPAELLGTVSVVGAHAGAAAGGAAAPRRAVVIKRMDLVASPESMKGRGDSDDSDDSDDKEYQHPATDFASNFRGLVDDAMRTAAAAMSPIATKRPSRAVASSTVPTSTLASTLPACRNQVQPVKRNSAKGGAGSGVRVGDGVGGGNEPIKKVKRPSLPPLSLPKNTVTIDLSLYPNETLPLREAAVECDQDDSDDDTAAPADDNNNNNNNDDDEEANDGGNNGEEGDQAKTDNERKQIKEKENDSQKTLTKTNILAKTKPKGKMTIRTYEDMTQMPYLHEAAILYNIKGRYEGRYGDRHKHNHHNHHHHHHRRRADMKDSNEEGHPYTRSGDIVVSVNPYKWIRGLYAERTRRRYAEELVWKANPDARSYLQPHLYEVSSLAFRGMLRNGGKPQSILVSGESGAGKTVAVKILMSHLATFHETNKGRKEAGNVEGGGDDDDNDDDDDEEMRQSVYLINSETKVGGWGKKKGMDEARNTESKLTESGGKGDAGGSLLSWITGLMFGFAYATVPSVEGKMSNIEAAADEETGYNPTAVKEEADVNEDVDDDDEPEEMSQTNLIVQRVLDSNPLLEAFGNAKTRLNGNSSRFGKYVKLQFHLEYAGRAHPRCRIAGSRCETYLLEKSRVVGHDADGDERTFHIFYQMLEGASESYKAWIWDGLRGKDASSFRYVGINRAGAIEGMTDAQRWKKTLAALRTVGLDEESIRTLMRALCAIMQLGNVTFAPDPSNEDGSVVVSDLELGKFSSLLGVPNEDIRKALTSRTVVARGEHFIKPLTVTQAADARDALAKETYRRVFDWLVGVINDATCAERNYRGGEAMNGVGDGETSTTTSAAAAAPPTFSPSSFGVVGLLDIFGFECFEKNRYEQLLINHANERLQQKFTEDVFRSVREEYRDEGIDLAEVRYRDNRAVLDLLEGRLGLIDLLNEECLRPRGSDAGFVNKLYAHNRDRSSLSSTSSSSSNVPFSPSASSFSSSSPLIRNRRYGALEFGVEHFASPVTYDASQFVAKNADTLPDGVADIASRSENKLIRDGMTARRTESASGSESKRLHHRPSALAGDSVWTKFKGQLGALMDDIQKTRTWYVRCINPNREKRAGVMDLKYTMTQLRCAGLVSAVTMARSTFPNRLSFEDVLERFRFLAEYNFLKAQSIGSSETKDSLLAQLLAFGGGGGGQEGRAQGQGRLGGEDSSRRRRDVEILLEYLLRPLEAEGTTAVGDGKAYVVGKTRVFFRQGSLEYLESKRLKAFDRCATIIQSRVRRNAAVVQYAELRQNPPAAAAAFAVRQKQRGSFRAFLSAVFADSNPIITIAFMVLGKLFGFPSRSMRRGR